MKNDFMMIITGLWFGMKFRPFAFHIVWLGIAVAAGITGYYIPH